MTLRDGRDGKDGRDGVQGVPGDMGPRGFKGDKGLTGDRGEQGPVGEKGDKGDPGESIKGDTGARGIRGEPGINGKDGAPGARGPAGPQGRIGPMPEHEWDGTRLRFEIDVGVWGQWTDLQGPKGDPGARGAQGESAGGGSFYGGFPPEWDAPSDGKTYGRSNGSWVFVTSDVNDLTGFPGGTTRFLRADGTFAVPAGGGGGGSADWGTIGGDIADQTDLQDVLALKVNVADIGTAAAHASSDFATAAQGSTADSAVQPGDLATVATTGAYSDLTGRPSLATVATTGAYSDLTGKPSLATVATTGAYSDLSGKPTLGTAAAAATTDFATAAQGGKADTALQSADIASFSIAWSQLTSTPTTLSGYGITDAESSSHASSTYAPKASPTFTGTVTVPTPTGGDNTTKAASTAYVQTELGSYLTTTSAAATYATITNLALKAPLASPALTGTPTAPTAANGTNTTQLATCAFVLANGGGGSVAWSSVTGTPTTLSGYGITDAAPSASPTFTGTVTIPTPSGGDNSTKAASTAFVVAGFAPLASPALTGTPTAPTATGGTNTTQVATTAFVAAAIANPNVIYSSVSVNDINNTTSKTALVTIPIAGGTLGTAQSVDFLIQGDILSNGVTNTITWELKYGSTVIWADTTGALTNTSTVPRAFEFAGTISSAGATNSQNAWAALRMAVAANSATTGSGDLATAPSTTAGANFEVGSSTQSAEDSTTSLNLVLSITMTSASTTRAVRCRNAYAVVRGSTSGTRGPKGDTGASGAGTNSIAYKTVNTTAYTLAAADDGYLIDFTNASGCAVTVPTNASVAISAGFNCILGQNNGAGSGNVSFTAAGGVTCFPTTLTTRADGCMIGLIKIGTDSWREGGDTT